MSRPNFYRLLGLPITPPENDPQAIRQALHKKQAEWSRYRNHPTKGMQVRQYIGLIGEIERVMSDPGLREKEAKAAEQVLLEEARQKLITADRHVGLLLSKGSITAEEITRLAERHRIKKRTVFRRVQVNNRGMFAKIGRELDAIARKRKVRKKDIARLARQLGVDAAAIESRIESEVKKKFAEIDRYLNVRTTKEYITDEELSGLAKLFRLPESEILKRVKCPIRKKSEIGAEGISPLDKTIETVIEENLRIVGKSSLYDFLGLWIGSSLESLQKRTGEIEAEIRRIGQKNVFVTASAILAGHCISIFQSAESRNAYDLSKARARLKELNEDIEVAGMGGTLRPEYMEVLIRRAVGFGVDPDEAAAYIRGFCDRQGWQVEPVADDAPGPRKDRRRPMAAAAALALAIVAAAAFYLARGFLAEGEYEDLLARSGRQASLEESLDLLGRYRSEHPESKYAGEIDRQIDALRARIVERDYRRADDEAEELVKARRFQEAEKVYAAVLARHPDAPQAPETASRKAGLPLLHETSRFEALSAIPREAYAERIAAYSAFLADFPQAEHRRQVLDTFIGMQAPFYGHIQAEAETCDSRREWGPCLRLCDQFVQLYAGSRQADEVEALKAALLRKVAEAAELDSLKMRARMAGGDWEEARGVYRRYLDEHPDASTRPSIEAAIAELDEKEKETLLASARGRFLEGRAGSGRWGRTLFRPAGPVCAGGT